jgi:virulence-associated protein VapD
MNMPQFAICFDLDTKRMCDDAISDSKRTGIYAQAKDVFQSCGLKKHQQYSMYATEDHEDAFNVILKLPAVLKSQARDFCQYLSRFDVVRIEDSADIVDFLKNG